MKAQHVSIPNHGSIRIAVNCRSTASPFIVFVHGLGCAKSSFDGAFRAGSLESFSLLAVDLPGHGESEKRDSFTYTMEEHAAVLSRILEPHLAEPFHLVAHSMGGAVVLNLPESILGRAASFVNVEGNLTAGDCVISRQTASVPFETFVREILPLAQEGFSGYGAIESVSPLAFFRSAASLVAWSDSGKLLERFLNLPVPTLYVYGDENSGIDTIAALGQTPMVQIAGSGHFPMNDNPEEFYSAVGEFIRGVSPHK